MDIGEIEEKIQALLMARVTALGEGADYMEPYVFLSKIRRNRLPGGREKFSWRNTDILITARQKTDHGVIWILYEPDGETIMATFNQTY